MLNECVLWEVYPIPKVDETLAQLSGAAVFSKLDANSWLKGKMWCDWTILCACIHVYLSCNVCA